MNQFRRERRLRAIDPVLPARRAALSHCKRGLAQVPRHFCFEGSEEFVQRFPKAGKGTPRPAAFLTPAEDLVLEQMTVLTQGFSLPGSLESCRTGHGQSSGANPGGREGREERRARS